LSGRRPRRNRRLAPRRRLVQKLARLPHQHHALPLRRGRNLAQPRSRARKFIPLPSEHLHNSKLVRPLKFVLNRDPPRLRHHALNHRLVRHPRHTLKPIPLRRRTSRHSLSQQHRNRRKTKRRKKNKSCKGSQRQIRTQR
jgi:hypothetical protein